jgi:hypothetical protein
MKLSNPIINIEMTAALMMNPSRTEKRNPGENLGAFILMSNAKLTYGSL